MCIGREICVGWDDRYKLSSCWCCYKFGEVAFVVIVVLGGGLAHVALSDVDPANFSL